MAPNWTAPMPARRSIAAGASPRPKNGANTAKRDGEPEHRDGRGIEAARRLDEPEGEGPDERDEKEEGHRVGGRSDPEEGPRRLPSRRLTPATMVPRNTIAQTPRRRPEISRPPGAERARGWPS